MQKRKFCKWLKLFSSVDSSTTPSPSSLIRHSLLNGLVNRNLRSISLNLKSFMHRTMTNFGFLWYIIFNHTGGSCGRRNFHGELLNFTYTNTFNQR